ncbi:MAG: hypothetical protein F6J94_18830 [Moorea sp. SIO1F2]|uniref:hypothetical protein n=1 Tax=Moorena sp. SIO1F2 TaxID=2607819 RepID=UPI0013B97055|nr:hypothetical protein [Moorena sp. SIO1F2]NET83898.1 hypothetical protein [Moorena sp. SIO1F2]
MILTAHPTSFSLFPIPYSLLPTPYSLFPLLKVGSNNTNSKAYHRDDTYCPPYIFFPVPYSLLPTPYSLLPTPYSLLPTPYSLLPTSNSNPQLAFSCNWCI